MPTGIFISFEGLDGSGKTTQLRKLAAWLEQRGHSVVTTRNPGGTPLGERVRGLLLDSRTESAIGKIAPITELTLMFADRAQSIAQVIRPGIAEGKIVLCDRYTDSSEAYQGGGRGIGSERVLALHQAVCEDFQPEMTILLLPPLEIALPRARRRNTRATSAQGADENRFETEDDLFFVRVHEKYREIAARDAHRVVLIEDDASIDEIHARVVDAGSRRFPSLAR
jgi:dTMP kinase